MQDDSLILDSSLCFGKEVTTLPEELGMESFWGDQNPLPSSL